MSSTAWSPRVMSRGSSTSSRRPGTAGRARHGARRSLDRERRRRGRRGLRRDRPSRRDGRRHQVVADPAADRRRQRRAAPSTCSRPRATRGVARFVYASTIWVYGERAGAGAARRGHAARPAAAPLHGDEARGRDVLPLLSRSSTASDDDPPLRDPLRPARAAGRSRPGLHRQGAAGEPLTIAGDGSADAPVRLRQGSGRRRRRRARAAGGGPRLQPRRRRARQRAGDRRHRA